MPTGGASAPGVAATLQTAWASRGPLARLLLPVAVLYGAAIRLRRALYRRGALAIHRPAVPVVVVGNLIVGGAGKTPAVVAIVESLLRRGRHVGIVSRGYGGHGHGARAVTPATPADDCGDEPLLLRRRTGVPVVVGADRPAAVDALLAAHPEIDVIVSDDGLQHLALARDVEIIVFDDRGVGNGWLLPAGPLREPMPASPPIGAMVVYNGTSPSTPWPGWRGERQLAGLVRLADWRAGERAALEPLTAWSGRGVIAAAGIARPERFFAMLAAAGLRVRPLPLDDHHAFDAVPWPADEGPVVVTEKDAVKLDPSRIGGADVWVAPLDFRPEAGFEDALLARLAPHLPVAPWKPDS